MLARRRNGAMARLGGQKGIFREMVEFFFKDGLRLVAEIRVAEATGDFVAIQAA